MSSVAGYGGKIYYAPDSTGSPGSWTEVVSGKSSALESMIKELETTNYGNGGRTSRIPGLKDVKGDADFFYDSGDTGGQVAMRTAMEAGTLFWIKILPDGTNGKYFQVFGTSSKISGEVGGVVGWTPTIVATGSAAPTAVP